MFEILGKLKESETSPRRLPLDFDAGILVGLFCACYAGLLGFFRGVSTDTLTVWALVALVLVFGIAGVVVGSVIGGRPDFGPSKRTAAVRGFVAVIPLYATGGLLFLSVGAWFSLLPVLSVAAAAIVGPPIGIFVYRTYRRRDATDSSIEPGVELAWLKGELLGGWTPLLVSIAILGSLGIGMRALPEEVTAPDPSPPAPPTLSELFELLPDLQAAVREDASDPEARLQLGNALFSMGRFGAAAAEYRETVLLDSSMVDAWRGLGRATYYTGQHQQAARAYWNVLRLDPAALSSPGLDRVVLDAALSSQLLNDTVPETTN